MSKEEPRKLDIEVEMTVFGAQWFRLRPLSILGNLVDDYLTYTRLLTPAATSRYPTGGWSIQALSNDEGMALFLAEEFASTRQNAMYTGPDYSTDIAAAWDVEEEIQRRGLYAEYGEAMSVMLDSPFVSASYYDFLHASPELRCRAALAAVRLSRT